MRTTIRRGPLEGVVLRLGDEGAHAQPLPGRHPLHALAQPTARVVGPGREHLAIFERLCRESGAAGKLVADAQHAAVAIENGCTMVTTDSDYDRFPGLRWQHPLRPGPRKR